ncbi:hypothetical protein BH18THE2_BH18THE2_28110 [soil metagenome]
MGRGASIASQEEGSTDKKIDLGRHNLQAPGKKKNITQSQIDFICLSISLSHGHTGRVHAFTRISAADTSYLGNQKILKRMSFYYYNCVFSVD